MVTNEELAVRGDLPTLWEQTRRLLYLKAREFFWHYGPDFCASHGVTLEDLEQTSYLAFLDAVRAYNPAKGYKFNTYLSFMAKNRFKAAAGLRKAHQDPLNIADTLNRPALDDDAGEWGDLLPDARAEEEIALVDERDRKARVYGLLALAMQDLTPTQAQVIRCRYTGQLTRQQTVESLHIAPEAVRGEEQKAMRELRRNAYTHEIMDLWRRENL